MINITVDQSSVERTVDYIQMVKERVLVNVRIGMREAVDMTAAETLAAMEGAGIQMHTGELATAILNSAKVRETSTVISCRVSMRANMSEGTGASRRTFVGYLGTALDEGYTVKAVEGLLYQFAEPSSDTLFTRGHQAFDVRPHPFLRQTVSALEQPILDIIRARMAEAFEK